MTTYSLEAIIQFGTYDRITDEQTLLVGETGQVSLTTDTTSDTFSYSVYDTYNSDFGTYANVELQGFGNQLFLSTDFAEYSFADFDYLEVELETVYWDGDQETTVMDITFGGGTSEKTTDFYGSIIVYLAGDALPDITSINDIAFFGSLIDSIDDTAPAGFEEFDAIPFSGLDSFSISEIDNIYGTDAIDIVDLGDGGDTYEGRGGNDNIIGGAGRDILLGEDGEDTIYGGSERDKIYGGNDDDMLYGEDGNDAVFGGTGQDTLYGGAGRDTLKGGSGHDTLHGGDARDLLYGGKQQDTVYGDDGKDLVDGGSHNDVLYGGADDDTLKGRQGADTLYGEDGDDKLYGGKNQDILVGGLGDDTLHGGSHADTFKFTKDTDYGDDVILDFVLGEDVLYFDPAGGYSFGTSGDDTVFYFSGGGSVTIEGVTGWTDHFDFF